MKLYSIQKHKLLNYCDVGTICVMFFGYSRNGTKGKTYILCIKQTPTIQKYPSDRSMKYGVSTMMTHFHEQDYAWIRRGMLFPFQEHVDRFVTVICILMLI